MSCRAVFFQVPMFEGNGQEFAEKLLTENMYPETLEKPDIIITLMESTLNPHKFDFISADIPKLRIFEQQMDTVFASPLRVHTFGGATWKSEFAFLAGVAVY